MGGGTGIYPVVSALKDLSADIATVVAASDSGGSTGRIRDEFGFPPVGDLRQSLAALAQEDGQEWIRKILLYRFEKGEGLKGHNLGNLILTALQDMTGSTTQALEIAEKVFRLNGNVIPVTDVPVELKITFDDGTTVVGEHTLDEEDVRHEKRIESVELQPAARFNPAGERAVQQANLIIIGPGDYYASLMAVLVATGVKEALQNTLAKVVYIVNLMTRSTQTKDLTAAEHLRGIEAAIGRKVDLVLINNGAIPQPLLDLYASEAEFPVQDDLGQDPRVIRTDLVEAEIFKKLESDTAHRSLLRHSKTKLQAVLERIV